MRLTPLDLRNHVFPRRVVGYSTEEVDQFLRLVAEDYEAVLREAGAAREQVARLEQRVEELSAHERVLKETLVTAQKLSEDLKRTAIKEAEVIISEAEIKGEKVLEAAHRRAAKLAEDIREMKQLRIRLAAAVRAAVATHLKLLDGLASDTPDDPALEGKVAYLTRPKEPRTGREG